MSRTVGQRSLAVLSALLFVVVGLFGACGETASPPAPGSTEVTEGARLYSSSCASCHGDRGQGRTAIAVNDGELALADIIDAVANGRTRMPAFGEALTAGQIEAVAEHVRSFAAERPSE